MRECVINHTFLLKLRLKYYLTVRRRLKEEKEGVGVGEESTVVISQHIRMYKSIQCRKLTGCYEKRETNKSLKKKRFILPTGVSTRPIFFSDYEIHR